jgi:hypothetical protein
LGNSRLLHGRAATVLIRNGTAKVEQNVSAAAPVMLNRKTVNRPARIYFLFMAVDKVSNLGVWNKFFLTAQPSQYRAYVHCKLPQCVDFVKSSVLQAVQTVPSYYCTDLVSPMNQLLVHALNDDPTSVNPADKFVFISDSSLPAKPFTEIYSTLALRTGSDLCAFPTNEWADSHDYNTGTMEMAVKVHQWIVLQRAHAQKATQLWGTGFLHNFMPTFEMNHFPYSYNNNTFADQRNFGCLDEFWHMAALFGFIKNVDSSRDQVVSLSGFTNSPLRVSKNVGWQGSCDTFVMWSKYLHMPGHNPFLKLYSSLDQASVPHGGNDQRPGWWDTISETGIQAIRKSDFLFVRKFIDNPRLTTGAAFETAYAHIVLGV